MCALCPLPSVLKTERHSPHITQPHIIDSPSQTIFYINTNTMQEGLEPLKKSEEERLKRVYDRIDKNADGYRWAQVL